MKPLKVNSKIETLLIAACLIPQLFAFVWGTASDVFVLFLISFSALLVLASYYAVLHKVSRYAFTFVLFISCIALDLYFGKQSAFQSYRAIARSLFGLWMLFSTVRMMLKSKNFELITFLASVSLMMNVLLFTVAGADQNIQMFLLFGSTFTLATVVYYENLWDRYSGLEKKWIIISLVSLVLDVLYFSKGVF